MPLTTDQKKIFAEINAKIKLSTAKLSDEYYYDSLPQCLIDAIFSIGTKYASTRKTVIRACDKLKRKRLDPLTHCQSDSYTIDEFIKDISKYSDYGMIDVYVNRQWTSSRSGIRKAEAVYKLADILKKHKVNTLKDIRSLSSTRLDDLEKEFISVKGQGSGISFSYFLMLSGDENHIKADRWILRFLKDVTGKKYAKTDAEKDLRDVCVELNKTYPTLTPRLLDHEIWKYMR